MSRSRNADCGLRIEKRGRCASTESAIRPGVPEPSASASPRRSFSLAELMIAIAILGIGLLVVAAMFPIAWTKAIGLARHTAAVSCADTAAQTVRLVTLVDSPEPGKNYTSFADDYVVETSSDPFAPGYNITDKFPMLPHGIMLPGAPRPVLVVHYLTTENVLVTKPSGQASPIIAEYGWPLIMAATGANYDLNNPADPERNFVNVVTQWFGPKPDGTYTPAVTLPQRLFPVLDSFPATASASPTPEEQEEIDAWTERMEGRRFCWAVFHRLTKLLNTDVPDRTHPDFIAAQQRAASRARVFDMYYVTLNRARGQRFARQDEAKLAIGAIKAVEDNPPSTPADVQFPSPWLVPLLAPEADGLDKAHRFLNFRSPAEMQLPPVNLTANDVADTVPRGVPTEVLIEVDTSKSDDFRDFFEPGTQCIDALNGQVYRVVKRRLVDPPTNFDDDRFDDDTAKPLKAVLTLDRELFVEDLRADPTSPYLPVDNAAAVSRQVWIFPGAIERTDKDAWAITGPPPVAAIEVRPLVITPH